jgi:prephenate dehydrogenase
VVAVTDPSVTLPPAAPLASLVVIGTGLLGTSIALAAVAAGVEVALDDSDAAALDGAQHITACRRWRDGMPAADHAVICVPPSSVAAALHRAQRLHMARTFSDVASVKSRPLVEAETAGVDMAVFVGGHPMAGRETAGPWNARADLFRGRPWPLVASLETNREAIAAAVALAELCGANPEPWSAAAHDAAVAAVSHVPQLVASALAASLADVDSGYFELAGAGLRDTTRLAGSPPAMWADICSQNAEAVAPRLRQVIDELTRVSARLEDQLAAMSSGADVAAAQASAAAAVARLVNDGNHVHRRLPQKRWSRLATGVSYGYVSVFVPDQPGGFADILRALADASVNVEDITVDHVPERPLGLVELTVLDREVGHAAAVLREAGFSATGRLEDDAEE